MNIDNTPLKKFVLIDTTQRPSYAFLAKAKLTEWEAKTKNYAFAMNGVKKKYILLEEWK